MNAIEWVSIMICCSNLVMSFNKKYKGFLGIMMHYFIILPIGWQLLLNSLESLESLETLHGKSRSLETQICRDFANPKCNYGFYANACKPSCMVNKL